MFSDLKGFRGDFGGGLTHARTDTSMGSKLSTTIFTGVALRALTVCPTIHSDDKHYSINASQQKNCWNNKAQYDRYYNIGLIVDTEVWCDPWRRWEAPQNSGRI